MKKFILFIAMFLLMSSNALASYTIYVLSPNVSGIREGNIYCSRIYKNVKSYRVGSYGAHYYFTYEGKEIVVPNALTIIEEE